MRHESGVHGSQSSQERGTAVLVEYGPAGPFVDKRIGGDADNQNVTMSAAFFEMVHMSGMNQIEATMAQADNGTIPTEARQKLFHHLGAQNATPVTIPGR
jgi:hypothetical protein